LLLFTGLDAETKGKHIIRSDKHCIATATLVYE